MSNNQSLISQLDFGDGMGPRKLRADGNLIGKMITISDSYGTGTGGVTPWNTYLKNYLGIASGDFFNWSEGSMGFNNPSHGNRTVQQAMVSHESDISNPNEVTHIVFGLGINDTLAISGLAAAIDSCMTYTKTRYPNAKIYIGFIGNSTSKNFDNYVFALKQYTNRSGCNGVAYIKGVENILHNLRLIQNDGVHPTDAGNQEIASYIASFIRGGGADYTFVDTCTITPESKFSTASLYVDLHNDVIKLKLTLNYTAEAFTLATNQYIKVGTIVDPVVKGVSGNKLSLCPCMVHNGTEFVMISWCIYDGCIYLVSRSTINVPANTNTICDWSLIEETIEI